MVVCRNDQLVELVVSGCWLLPEDTVINLSNVQLSQAEIKLLSRGLTFVPTPQRINWSEIQADIDDFARRLRLKELFDKDGNTATA